MGEKAKHSVRPDALREHVFERFTHDEMQVLAKAVARITDNLEG